MQSLLHTLATLALLPYVVLATGFLLLGHVASRGSLWAFLDALVTQASWIMPWGILGLAGATLALLVLGFMPRLRWVGGLVLCGVAALSLLVLLFGGKARIGAGELLFLLPCALVLLYGGWLARAGWQAPAG